MKQRKHILEDCTRCNGKPKTEEQTETKILGDFKISICLECGECLASEKVIVAKESKKTKTKITSQISKELLSFSLNRVYKEDTFIQIKGIESNSVSLVIEDTPYGYNYQSNARKNKFSKIDNDSNLDWLDEHIKDCYRILKDNSYAFFFCQDKVIDIFKSTIEKYFDVKNILTWEKGGGGMGDLEGSRAKDTEFIIMCAKGKPKLKSKRKGSSIKVPKDNGADYQHPTQKPVNLIRQLISDTTDVDDIVFDGFMGRGTTAIACIVENRRFLGFEKDEEYFEICQENIKKAKLGLNVLDPKVLKSKIKTEKVFEQLKMF